MFEDGAKQCSLCCAKYSIAFVSYKLRLTAAAAKHVRPASAQGHAVPPVNHAMIDMQLTTQTFHLGRFTDLQPLRPRMKARPRILQGGEPATVTAQFQPSIPASSARRSRRSSSPQPGRLLGYAGRKGGKVGGLFLFKNPVRSLGKSNRRRRDAPRYTPRHTLRIGSSSTWKTGAMHLSFTLAEPGKTIRASSAGLGQELTWRGCPLLPKSDITDYENSPRNIPIISCESPWRVGEARG